jgi:hypothetical protein
LSCTSTAQAATARDGRTTRPKWRERLQRELLKIWLVFSALWVGCILLILGQCLYGRWFGWQLPQCDGPL